MKAIITKNRRYVKIDKHDTWSMDETLAHIVVPMLVQLRDSTHGSPFVEFEDRPENLVGTLPDPKSGDTDEFHHQAWYWALDEMIFAFSSKLEDWEDQFISGTTDLQTEDMGNGYSKVVWGDKHTWCCDWDARKEYQDRISNGFLLFGKYYEGLWD